MKAQTRAQQELQARMIARLGGVRCWQCLAVLPEIGACRAELVADGVRKHGGMCWGGMIPADPSEREVEPDDPLPELAEKLHEQAQQLRLKLDVEASDWL